MITTDTHIYFWNGIYSNWHPARFQCPISGIVFENSEQAFMWKKAEFFDDDEIKLKIAKESSPRVVKYYGREIKNYDDAKWALVRYDIMVDVNILKFSQNNDLKNELLDSENKVIVEASPVDPIWGSWSGRDKSTYS